MRPTRVSRALFDRLAGHWAEFLISIYLPTHEKGAETTQDRIRLKNGISAVDDWLEQAGWKPRQREERLAEPKALLLDDTGFWEHQALGLAVFVDEAGKTTTCSLSEGATAREVVSPYFHIRPLIASLEMVQAPVLVLTLGGVRLYEATRHETQRVDADLPESFDDVNWFVDREKQRQQHADAAGAMGARHGHDPAQQSHEDLERFLRSVAGALPEFGGDATLVVLGDDNLVARFAATYGGEISTAPRSGIQDANNVGEVHGKAREVVGTLEALRRDKRCEFARSRLETGGITDLDEALEAAVSGRLSDLVLHRAAPPMWGRFDPETLDVTRHQEQGLLDVDLLDRLAHHSVGTGASISTTDEPIEGFSFVAVPRF